MYSTPPEIYTLSLHDALPILQSGRGCLRAAPPPPDGDDRRRELVARPRGGARARREQGRRRARRSEEHTSELQSRGHLVCRLLLEKKKQHRLLSASTTHGCAQ